MEHTHAPDVPRTAMSRHVGPVELPPVPVELPPVAPVHVRPPVADVPAVKPGRQAHAPVGPAAALGGHTVAGTHTELINEVPAGHTHLACVAFQMPPVTSTLAQGAHVRGAADWG